MPPWMRGGAVPPTPPATGKALCSQRVFLVSFMGLFFKNAESGGGGCKVAGCDSKKEPVLEIGPQGVTTDVTPSPVAHEKARRLPPCRTFLWLQAVSGGTTESVVWVILLTFPQLFPGERLPAPLAAVFFPSPAHGSHTRAIRALTAFQIDFLPPRFP